LAGVAAPWVPHDATAIQRTRRAVGHRPVGVPYLFGGVPGGRNTAICGDQARNIEAVRYERACCVHQFVMIASVEYRLRFIRNASRGEHGLFSDGAAMARWNAQVDFSACCLTGVHGWL
jgi:hypothetical protein